MAMESVWVASALAVLVYMNYLMFRDYLTAIFWAMTYSVLAREIGKRNLNRFLPLLPLALMFPLASLTILPSAILVMCSMEIAEWSRSLLALVSSNSLLSSSAEKAVKLGTQVVLEFLEFEETDELSRGVVYYKVYIKLCKYVDEIKAGTASVMGTAARFAFFLGMVGYFSQLQHNPLEYVLRPLGYKGGLIVKSYESVVYSLFTACLFNFCASLVLGLAFGSLLPLTGATASALLAVFPVAPVFLYSLPGAVHMILAEKYVLAAGFCASALVQWVICSKMYSFRFSRNCVKTISIVLGLKVFGLHGAILGPCIISSLLILWPGSPVIRPPPEQTLAKKEPKPSKTMEILKKNS